MVINDLPVCSTLRSGSFHIFIISYGQYGPAEVCDITTRTLALEKA